MNTKSRQHYPIGKQPIHITYRLYGSIPKKFQEALQIKRQRELHKARDEASRLSAGLAGQILVKREFEINARYELAFDEYLHNGTNGPYYLSRPEWVVEILKSYAYLHENNDVFVYAVCVMSNHVHAIVRGPDDVDHVDIGALMSRHKRHTARKCNELLNVTGNPFWDEGYFDRTIRQGKFTTVMWYVLNNPVKAGLVDNWREWPGCWLNPAYASLFTPL